MADEPTTNNQTTPPPAPLPASGEGEVSGQGTPPPAQTPPATPPAQPEGSTPPPAPSGEGDQGEQRDPVPYHRFQEVNNQLQEARESLKTVDALKAENMRLRVAAENGIPLAVAELLQGDTPEALTAHYQTLITALGVGQQGADSGSNAPTPPPEPNSPGVPPPSSGSAPEALPDFGKMSNEEVMAWAKQQGM